jgi:tetratricopeptide (TPR) repeat protein
MRSGSNTHHVLATFCHLFYATLGFIETPTAGTGIAHLLCDTYRTQGPTALATEAKKECGANHCLAAILSNDSLNGDIRTATQLLQKGRNSESAAICFEVLAIAPNHPDALRLLGLIAHQRGDRPLARSLLARALDAAPNRADILNDFGLELMAQGKFRAAIQNFNKAHRLQPQMLQALYNKGLAEKSIGNIDAALDSFKATLAREPDFFKAHFCIGDLFLTHGNLDAASFHFLKAITINPGYIAAYNHLAISLSEQQRLNEALQWLSKAHEINPQCADTLCNMGNLLRKMKRFDDAEKMYRCAIDRRADFIEAHLNLAIVLLLRGRFKEGWQQYEWRLKHFHAASGYPCRHGLPLWTGQSLSGKAILVYDEQGFGDILMSCRFLKTLKSMDATIVFETRKELFEFFKHFEWADEVVLRQEDLKPRITCDYCLPLLSLPHRFNINMEDIHGQEPYLKADPAKTAQWSRRITGAGLKVGLVWSGSSADPARRLDINQLSLLSKTTGICWYSLQKDAPGELTSEETPDWINALGPQLVDFTDTAAAIANLDLVISIDTAVAHLAGAMGKPVWVLLPFVPDWRWFLDTPDTPWYASMRLFRQVAPGDWQTPLKDIYTALQSLIRPRSTDTQGETAIDMLLSKAASHRRSGEHQKALSTYRQILGVAPDCYEAFFSLGLLYMETASYPEAIVSFEQALWIKSEDHLSLNNLGLAYHRSGQLDPAETAFKKAIKIRPDFITAYYNIGNLYLDREDLESTIVWYGRALELTPDDAQAQCEMGKLYLKALDLTNALAHFHKAAALDSRCSEAAISIATTTLLQGDLANGLKYYRNRFKYKSSRDQAFPYQYCLKLWQGETFTNRKLIVHCEQGFGDTIQFSRFLPVVKARGGHVTFQIQPDLMPLFKNFPGADILEPLPQLQPKNPDADLYVPLMDIPACLDITLETIPAPQPYLTADPRMVNAWRSRINAAKRKVGLAWTGNPHHSNDRNRSCSLRNLMELNNLDGVQFYSLQKDINDTDASILKNETSIIDIGSGFKNFGDTAAAIECLDLIISVDTAVAHLAGAMAKPVWIILPYLPDWRWMLYRSNSPWYPSMRLFRQPQAGDWAPVISELKQQLESLPCR